MEGNDSIVGLESSDELYGDEGNDSIQGGDHSDQLYGDEGNDTIDDSEPVFDADFIFGHGGNDTIEVQEGDNGANTVDCGPGQKDKVVFDQGVDTVRKNCEIRTPLQ
jgi:Ca2+-binding RTX toxin-like protein